MNRSRKALVGVVALLSLLGVGAVAQPAGAHSSHRISAERWCC